MLGKRRLPWRRFKINVVDRGRRRLCPSYVGIEVLKSERKLVAVESFRSPTELRALQSLNDKSKALDLGPYLRKLGSVPRGLRGQLAHHPMQRIDIGGERGEIEIHVCESNSSLRRHPR